MATVDLYEFSDYTSDVYREFMVKNEPGTKYLIEWFQRYGMHDEKITPMMRYLGKTLIKRISGGAKL